MGVRRLVAIQLTVSIVALAGVAWWASKQQLPALPSLDDALGPLLGALGLYVLATLLRGERWLVILGMGGVDTNRADAYAVTTIGYMGNNALPARAGDLMKAMISAHRASAPRRDAFGALLAERLLDAVALTAIFAVLVLVVGLPLGLSPLMIALIGGALAIAIGVVVIATPRLRGLIAALLAPSRAMAGPRGIALLGLSLLIWLAEGGVYAMLGTVAGLDLSLKDGMYVMALANAATMIPAAPGYVGTYDAAILLAVRLISGGTRTVALPYVALIRFVLFVPIVIVGLLCLVGRYGGFRTLRAARAVGS